MSTVRIWPRPRLICEPDRTDGNVNTSCSLSGEWLFTPEAYDGFEKKDLDRSAWETVPVPMSLSILGIRIPNGVEYAYARLFRIPQEYSGKRIILRFDSVNCLARVFVDGVYQRSHFGGFNSWDVDITDAARPGEEQLLVVGVKNMSGLMSQFHSGGIQRDVRIIAVPEDHLTRMHADTTFEDGYAKGILRVTYAMSHGDGAQVRFTLRDAQGETAAIRMAEVNDAEDAEFTMTVPNVHKWDSEHPYLYTLTAEVFSGREKTETFSRRIGFREVKRIEDRVFVNGDEVKLRGVDREEVHPLKGRAIDNNDILQDVLLLKEANCNFVRTSHYNPSQYFLELCDEYGIYVEEETSVSFVGQGQAYSSDDPAYTAYYMDQFAEMIEKDRSHPCVIIWSLANESVWGENFAKELRYARQEDPSRLTIFSYPITMLEDDEMVDIWSAHYNNWDQDKAAMTHNSNIGGSFGPHRYPVLHDEYIHIPCYNKDELGHDQGIRDAWGESVKRFWADIYDTKGALGGAIWCFCDEVWLEKDRPSSVYEWGIIDGFRRRKPEFYLTRKGYSPICLDEKAVFEDGKYTVRIRNRYNHTDLSEITAIWDNGNASGEFTCPETKCGDWNLLRLPAEAFRGCDRCLISFREGNGRVCDDFYVTVRDEEIALPEMSRRAPGVNDEEDTLFISCGDILYIFSKDTGRFSCYRNDEEIVKDGPYLNLKKFEVEDWTTEKFVWACDSEKCVIDVSGRYGLVGIAYHYEIDDRGLMSISYTFTDMPYAPHKTVFRNYDGSNTKHVGGMSEVGLTFRVPSSFDRLKWDRKGLWNTYPEDHIGRLKGTAVKVREPGRDEKYREVPEWDWKDDMRNHKLFGLYDFGGRGTQDFASSKDGMIDCCVYPEGRDIGLCAWSDGSDSVKCDIDKDPELVIAPDDPRVEWRGEWETRQNVFGTFSGQEKVSRRKGDSAEVTFTGTGIAWFACRNACYGIAEVWLDGKCVAPSIALGTDGSVLRGEEFQTGSLAYAVEDLPFGEHTLLIKVKGKPAPGAKNRNISPDTYVSIDHFELPGRVYSGDVLFTINNRLNYTGIAWGNYTKPIVEVKTGDSYRVLIAPLTKD